MKTSPELTPFKNLEEKLVRESPKRTISASGGFGRLQIVSKPDTGRCVKAELQRGGGGWTRGGVPAMTLVPKGGGLGVAHRLEKEMSASEDVGTRKEVDCEIPHRLRRRMKFSL